MRFQSTRPRGARRHHVPRDRPADRGFNPRARAGRDLTPFRSFLPLQLFQSTRPRGARLEAQVGLDDTEVSIHAPARGATDRTGRQRSPGRVSIHAPARGATPLRLPCQPCCGGFNPRARAGRDQRSQPGRAVRAGFNPRARAGRDLFFMSTVSRDSCFNPRARAGRDACGPCRCAPYSWMFQSTRPRGARLKRAQERIEQLRFQSTRPRGARRALVMPAV